MQVHKKLVAIDSMRGIAAVFVVLLHIPVDWYFYYNSIIMNSYLFVDFFFMLSGFVISLNYRGRIENASQARQFVAARLRRVYPLHIFVMISFAAFQILRLLLSYRHGIEFDNSGGRYSLYNFVVSALLLNSFGLATGPSWNFPSWSISTEVFAYTIFCVTTFKFKRNFNLLWLALIACSLTLIAFFHLQEGSTDFGVLRGIAGFGIGIFLNDFVRISRADFQISFLNGKIFSTALELIIVVCCIFIFSNYSTISFWWWVPYPAFACLIYLLAMERGIVSSLLMTFPFRYLGKISYSVYMVHALVLSVIFGAIRLLDKDSEQFSWIPVSGDIVNRHMFLLVSKAVPGELLVGLILIIILILAHFTFNEVEVRFRKSTSSRIANKEARITPN